MITLNCEQLSDEWFQARAGNIGASSFDKVLSPTGKPSAQAKKLMYTLAIETITGTKESSYQSAAMERGMELEADARQLYELINGVEVQQVGLCYPDEGRHFHASPDGIMPDLKRGLEIKCPVASTHAEYLIKGTLPTKYIPQVQGSMLVTGYDEWSFMSFYPAVKPLIITIKRDPEYIKLLGSALYKFVGELANLVKKLS